jgi:mannose-6-phosphate isomerase
MNVNHELESRPWGTYEVLLDSPECKVKRITVNPDQKLSYQYHLKRDERWVVVKGHLTVILNDEQINLEYGQHLLIKQGDTHRAWNKTDEIVQFIEVQTGTYFGEDDIIRLEDDYNRVELEHLADGNYIGGLTMPKKNNK